MYKFVVFCAVLAAAFAEPEPSPGAVLAAPSAAVLPYSAPYYPGYAAAPYYAASPYYSSPSYYSAPLAYSHYIKKRSAVFSPAVLPSAYSYYASAPALAAPAYSTSLYSGAAILPSTHLTYSAPAHYIKKRSVGYALPSTYIAPTTYAAAPYLNPGYAAAAAPYYSSPYFASPYTYSTYIKK